MVAASLGIISVPGPGVLYLGPDPRKHNREGGGGRLWWCPPAGTRQELQTLLRISAVTHQGQGIGTVVQDFADALQSV